MAPAMYCIISLDEPPRSLTVPMIAKNAAMKANDTPWMMGKREPKVVWINVARPLHNMTDEIRIPIS